MSKTEKIKRFVTAQDMQKNRHLAIEAKDITEAWKISQYLLSLGEHRYRQVRFRRSRPPATKYILLKSLGGA